MIDRQDLVIKDGEELRLGNNVFRSLETPGHTWGTVSYLYDVLREGSRHRAVTVGGLGLNAISVPSSLKPTLKACADWRCQSLALRLT